ncbi:MAG: phosphatase PAP2 family protein [Deltaproteobacteria bacterium]|nr:phosphatase PAP2 family protein [Deltaproteobacteria bacterium]
MESSVQRYPGLLHTFSPYLRQYLLAYGVGVVVSLQFLALVELLVDLPPESPGPVAFSVFAGPALAAIPLAAWRGRAGSRLGIGSWLPNMLAMLAFAGFGYFIVAGLASSEAYWSLEMAADRAIPEIRPWVFFYLTVYFVYAIPLLYLDDVRQLAKLGVAQVATLLVCYVVFVAFPVATVRVAVPVSDISSYTLALVRELDPPWNCFPSTHCTICTIASLAVWRQHRWMGLWLVVSTVLICVSTLLTKQHYLLDVLAGVLLGGLVWVAVDKGEHGARLVNHVAGLLARLEGKGGRA